MPLQPSPSSDTFIRVPIIVIIAIVIISVSIRVATWAAVAVATAAVGSQHSIEHKKQSQKMFKHTRQNTKHTPTQNATNPTS